ncbi:MAG: hypothetical protein E7576_14435 [Ruminococcaceae bacterium]|nr:hypothetical protein [Oscillospiraceae bacterium]
MNIENNVLRYYLRNAYFITGTAYAGKSTMVKMLSERYGMIACGENYHMDIAERCADPDIQPNLCYFRTMKSWEEFVRRTPEEYERWMYDSGKEAAGIEIAELISLSGQGRAIVDTNIPLPVLREISSYDHVAVMLSPQSMSVDRFFDRSDPEKRFLFDVIENCEDSAAVMENYRAGLARINSPEHYREYAESGFYTVVRENTEEDTRDAVCEELARHFKLI